MKYFLMALCLAVCGVASATDFAPATDGTFKCANMYCTGYATSDTHTVESVSLQKRAGSHYYLSISVDGKLYYGNAAGIIPTSLIASDGSFLLATVDGFTSHYRCAREGRATVCVTDYQVYTGSVESP